MSCNKENCNCKDKKTMWIVAGVVAFIIAVGLGIMFSGEKEEIITIPVPEAPTYVMDSAGNFVAVDSVPEVDSTIE